MFNSRFISTRATQIICSRKLHFSNFIYSNVLNVTIRLLKTRLCCVILLVTGASSFGSKQSLLLWKNVWKFTLANSLKTYPNSKFHTFIALLHNYSLERAHVRRRHLCGCCCFRWFQRCCFRFRVHIYAHSAYLRIKHLYKLKILKMMAWISRILMK